MYYKSRCIILKNRDLRETDKLVTIFSEPEGKTTAVAKGIKKPKSSLRGCIQPFCHSLLFFSRGRELDLITQGQLLDFFGNTREDMQRTLHVMYMMELLDKSLLPGVALPELYARVLRILDIVNRQGLNHIYIRYFEIQLLNSLGYRPQLNCCQRCGATNLRGFCFSLADGGLLCPQCRAGEEAGIELRAETIALLRLLAEDKLTAACRVKASPRTSQEMEYLLERYLEYHLETRLNIKTTMRVLKKSLAVLD